MEKDRGPPRRAKGKEGGKARDRRSLVDADKLQRGMEGLEEVSQSDKRRV